MLGLSLTTQNPIWSVHSSRPWLLINKFKGAELSALNWPISFPARSGHVSLSANLWMGYFPSYLDSQLKSLPFAVSSNLTFFLPVPICFLCHELYRHSGLSTWNLSLFTWFLFFLQISAETSSGNFPSKSPWLHVLTILCTFSFTKVITLRILHFFRAHGWVCSSLWLHLSWWKY